MKPHVVPASSPSLFKRPAVAVALVLLAAAVWGFVFFGLGQGSPAAPQVEAGREAVRMGRPQEAERAWKEAVRLDPNNATAWELLAEYYSAHEDWANALKPLRELARLKPDTPHIYVRLADCAFKVGDPLSALADAERELKRDPNNVGALVIAARVLSVMEEEKRRLEYLRRLARLRPDDPDILAMLARALVGTHFNAEARAVIARLFQLDPNNAEAYALRGRVAFDEGPMPQGLAQAEADLLKSVQMSPQAATPRLYLGKVYLQMRQPQKAIPYLEEAARLAPRRPDVFFALASAYDQVRQPEKAVRARRRFVALRQDADRVSSLEKRCAIEPDSYANHLQLGLLTLKTGDYDRADYYLNRAMILRPGDSQAKAALRQLAALSGERGQSGTSSHAAGGP